MLLRVICVLVLCGILVAGLWPFHAPRNQVHWLGRGNGLQFGKYGSVVSAGAFRNTPQTDGSCSLEIWLLPKRARASGTILSFYRPQSDVAPFALRQSLSDLVLQRQSRNQSRRVRTIKVYVDDVLRQRKPILLAISSGPAGTTVYADGVLVKRIAGFAISNQELSGRLVLGNSPVTTDEWAGQIKGLAVYNRQLSADEVLQHYENWASNNEPVLTGDENAVALYRFNEGSGNIVHNHIDAATDLLIPDRFFVVHAQFLERPWDEFRPDWNYWKDVGINIAGFIPLGFFFYAYLILARRTERPALAVILFGFAVSLTIEVLQSFLPTRDSGMTDLMTNTLGTAIGVGILRLGFVQALLAGFGILPEPTKASGRATHSRNEVENREFVSSCER